MKTKYKFKKIIGKQVLIDNPWIENQIFVALEKCGQFSRQKPEYYDIFSDVYLFEQIRDWIKGYWFPHTEPKQLKICIDLANWAKNNKNNCDEAYKNYINIKGVGLFNKECDLIQKDYIEIYNAYCMAKALSSGFLLKQLNDSADRIEQSFYDKWFDYCIEPTQEKLVKAYDTNHPLRGYCFFNSTAYHILGFKELENIYHYQILGIKPIKTEYY